MSAIVEFGHVDRSYFCCFSAKMPARRGAIVAFRSWGCGRNELHAECYLGIVEHDDCLIGLLDGTWHDISVFVINSHANNIVVMVDGKYPVPLPNVWAASKFLPGTDGTVSAIVNNRPSMPFHGNITYGIANLVALQTKKPIKRAKSFPRKHHLNLISVGGAPFTANTFAKRHRNNLSMNCRSRLNLASAFQSSTRLLGCPHSVLFSVTAVEMVYIAWCALHG